MLRAFSVVSGFSAAYPKSGRRIYPSQVLLNAGDGGLDVTSVALGEQVRVLAKGRLGRRRGILSDEAMGQIDRALLIALDLAGSVDI